MYYPYTKFVQTANTEKTTHLFSYVTTLLAAILRSRDAKLGNSNDNISAALKSDGTQNSKRSVILYFGI